MTKMKCIIAPLALVLFVLFTVCLSNRSVFGSSLEEASRLDDRAVELYQQGRYGEAIVYAEKALKIYRKTLGETHKDTATSYNNLGLSYKAMGNYAKAEAMYQKALAIYEEVLGQRHPHTATSYNNLAVLYKDMGNYRKAETMYQKALTIDRHVFGEKHANTATSYANLGSLYQAMGDYTNAKPLKQKALAIRSQVLGEKHPDTATSYNSLGVFYFSMGDFVKAEDMYQKALTVYQEVLGKNHPHTASAYNNLAVHYRSMGDYKRAEPLLKRALAICDELLGENHPLTATIYNSLGLLYSSMGDYGRAELLFQKALAIDEKMEGENHPSTATSYNNLGTLYHSMRDYTKAETMYQKALTIDRHVFGEKNPSTTVSYTNLGGLYLETGEVAQAMAIFKKENAVSGIARCYLAEMDYIKARNEFRRSLAGSEKGGKTNFIIGDLVGLGLSLEGLEDYKGAKDQFQRAISIIESQRGELSGGARETFMGGKVGAGFSRMDAYEGMIRVIWKEKRKGYEAEALRYCERVKSRVLLEMLATRGVKGRDAADEKIMARDREFQRKLISLRKLEKTLDELADKAPRGRLGEARKELAQTEAAYETFIKDVKLKNAELASLITVDVPSAGKLQSHLDDDTTLLEYFTGKDRTYAWLMTRDRICMHEIPVGEKEVSDRVNTLLLANISNRPRRPEPMIILAPGESKKTTEQERKRNREAFLDGAKEIHQALIAPVVGDIKTGKLIVAPHGALHKVPFGTLTDGETCLVDRYSITVVPSASVIPQVASKRKAKPGALLAMGNPQTEYVPLGFAEAEVDQIGRFFPAKKVYVRDKATEKRLKTEAAGPGVIHLACHGEFHDRQPLQSGLLLADGAGDDGRLQVHEIFGMDLRNASLVTLSACETALGTISTGDDMVGLSRAFIYAGTPSLIASLWEVDDQSTAILMTRFYDNWKNKGMTKPEALRQAQLSLKAMPRYRHPYHWAAFVLIGDWM